MPINLPRKDATGSGIFMSGLRAAACDASEVGQRAQGLGGGKQPTGRRIAGLQGCLRKQGSLSPKTLKFPRNLFRMNISCLDFDGGCDRNIATVRIWPGLGACSGYFLASHFVGRRV
jgi:hypothetical protein